MSGGGMNTGFSPFGLKTGQILDRVVKRVLVDPDQDGYTAILTAVATKITVSGLSGFDAIEFSFSVKLNTGALPTFFYCRPNDVASDLDVVTMTSTSAGAVSGGAASDRVIASGDVDRLYYEGQGSLVLVPGRGRGFNAQSSCLRGAANNAERIEFSSGFYKPVATVINSVAFLVDVASGMDVGTKLWVTGINWLPSL